VNVDARIIPVIVCGLILAAGCASTSPAHTPAPHPSDTSTQTTTADEQVWVLDSGWHTGLILARAELGPALIRLLQPAAAVQYLMFGWGNRRYYMSPDPTFGMGIAALFPSQSVLLIESCKLPPRACYTNVVKFHVVAVSAEGLRRLDDYLLHSLRAVDHGRLQPLAAGPDAGSKFYASGLSYDAFHTCNTWTAEALHDAGLPVDYHGVIFSGQLWRQLQ
jgi:uncharacterized protein (TIGR02117 family)